MDIHTAHLLTETVGRFVVQARDLRGLAVVGSWARGTPTPTSDLDLLVLATCPDRYTGRGACWLAVLDLTAAGFTLVKHEQRRYGVVTSHFLSLEPEAALELTIAHPDWACSDQIDDGTAAVVRGGFKIVVDKEGALRRLADALGVQG
jgi:hypothetical protein